MLDSKLHTFLEVCKQGNLTKAAQQLFITQPAVSQQMKALEEHYNCKLFAFSGKKLSLTDQGEKLYHYALGMLVNEQRMKEQLQLKSQSNPKLNFGATLTLGEFVLPNLLIGYAKAFPMVEIQMHVDNTMNLLEQIKKGDIDFAFIEGYYNKEAYDVIPFYEDSFIGVCSPNSELANQSLSLKDIQTKRLIVREEGSGTREVLERALSTCNRSIQEWNLIATIGNLGAIKEMVKEDLGISFLYEAAVRKELNNHSLCKLQLNDFDVKREYTVVSLKASNYTTQRDHLLRWFHESKSRVELI